MYKKKYKDISCYMIRFVLHCKKNILHTVYIFV